MAPISVAFAETYRLLSNFLNTGEWMSQGYFCLASTIDD
jgi:hypothetical protein